MKVHYIIRVCHSPDKAIREPLGILNVKVAAFGRRVLHLEPNQGQRLLCIGISPMQLLPLFVRLGNHLIDNGHEATRQLLAIVLLLG